MVFKWPSDWRDPDAMSYFLSDFSSHNIRPGRKLAFWCNLICEVCEYRKTPVVTISELKRCLAWRGMSPLCLEGVLDDMEGKQTAQRLEKLTETWTQWGVGMLTSPLTSMWTKIVSRAQSEQKFVILTVFKNCCNKVLCGVHSSDTILYKITDWNTLLRNYVAASNIDCINEYLVFSNNILLHGDPVHLVKVRTSTQNKVAPITQLDVALSKADATRDTLNTQICLLDNKIEELYKAAKGAKSRKEALSHLRRKKMHEKSRERWEGALNNTESLLLQLQESQHQKNIISTLKVGADALHQNKIPLTDVDDIMDQLEEYKSYEEDLSTTLTLDIGGIPDTDLESELMELLNEGGVEPASKRQSREPEVIDLTSEDDDDNILSSEELAELENIEGELSSCPAVPAQDVSHDVTRDVPRDVSRDGSHDFEDTEHAIEREQVPKDMKARLSPELRRKPGRKLVGVMAAESG